MSGGQLIGECLSRTLGFRYVTREDLVASVNAHGELANKVTASIGKAALDYAQFSNLRRPYKILMRLALLEYVRLGNVAYFGYSGHLLVEGLPGMLRVRLIAPLEMRVRMLMGQQQCAEAEAKEHIRQVDEERVRWARFLYARNIRSPELYDICLNLSGLSLHTACSILAHAAGETELQATEESTAAIEDLFLSTKALAALATDKETHALEIGASAKNGRLCLKGPHLEEAQKTTVLGIVSTVPGVLDIQYEPGYAPMFDVSF